MSKSLKKHFSRAKPVSVRLCMCVRVCAGWAAVPMQTPVRTNSIKQNRPQESDFPRARQQNFRLDVTQIFITSQKPRLDSIPTQLNPFITVTFWCLSFRLNIIPSSTTASIQVTFSLKISD